MYFETSAVNFLVDKLRVQDAIATKSLQLAKGNRWYLSPVVFWEVFLTGDDTRMEQIIFFCQHLFFNELLKSPSEIIIDYIERGLPRTQFYKEFHSNTSIAHVWKNAAGNPSVKFVFDKELLSDWTGYLKRASKKVAAIVNNIVFSIELDKEEEAMNVLINAVYENVDKAVKEKGVAVIQKLAILFIVYFLCLGIDLDARPVEDFWIRKGVQDKSDRLGFLLSHYPELLLRGPFFEFATMAVHQLNLKNSTGRGLFHDSLHCIYLPFVDVFSSTNDQHFTTYRDLRIQPYHKKIVSISKDVNLAGKFVEIEPSLFMPRSPLL